VKPVRALVVDGSDDPDGAARVHTAPSGAPTQTTGDSAPMRSSFSIHSLATDAFNYTVHSEPGIYMADRIVAGLGHTISATGRTASQAV
jgi:hypothetical protein